MASKSTPTSKTWRSTHNDQTDEEPNLIGDLFPVCGGDSRIDRAPEWQRRDLVNAILYVSVTGCRWRALPSNYSHCNTVHRNHVQGSRDGTRMMAGERLIEMVKEKEGRDPDPSAGIVDARSVRELPW